MMAMPGQLTVQLVGHGRSPRPGGHHVPLRSLPFVLLEWADAGGWELQLEARPVVHAPAPRVLVVAQEHAHSLRTLEQDCMTCYLLLRVEVDGMPALTDPALSGVLASAPSQRIHVLAERALAAAGTLQEMVHAQAALHRLVATVLECAAAVGLPRPHGRMAQVLARIEANLGEPLSRATLARWAGLSPTRFHAVFTRELGCSPMAYLRLRRLRRAQELLATSPLPIHQVASLCGFPSVYHFSRLFHHQHGCTPSTYRSARWER